MATVFCQGPGRLVRSGAHARLCLGPNTALRRFQTEARTRRIAWTYARPTRCCAYATRGGSVAVDELCEGGCQEEQHGSVLVRDDMDALLEVLPSNIRQPLEDHPDRSNLLEVVLDLGRRPEARFLGGRSEYLREEEIDRVDISSAEMAVGHFGTDNRAGIPGTLHRISAMRNRKGSVVGLTCRVGRAVTGHVDMIREVLEDKNSILFLGKPGVGKTTVIREIARVLSDDLKKRVVIVDTSNEIGGDGDVPHPAIGGARRMQVADAANQHQVMVEAVENHMPEVVIVDEIGTEAEAAACRTIAERGVQLIGTAHGQLLENLIKNPTLTDLVGGVQSVTLGDDEAKSRGTQKSILERRGPPTFPIVLEMRERSLWVAHWTEDSVDMLLQGKQPIVQVRQRDQDSGEVEVNEQEYDRVPVSSAPAPPPAPLEDNWDANWPLASDSASSSGSLSSGSGSTDDDWMWAQRLRGAADKEGVALQYAQGQSSILTYRPKNGFSYLNRQPQAAAGRSGKRNKARSQKTKARRG